MAVLRQVLTVPLSVLSFVYTLYAVGKLMWFLSAPQKVNIASTWLVNLLDNRSKVDVALLPLAVDTILVIIFILQHSLLKSEWVKSILAAMGLATVERSLYNIASAATLLVSY